MKTCLTYGAGLQNCSVFLWSLRLLFPYYYFSAVKSGLHTNSSLQSPFSFCN